MPHGAWAMDASPSQKPSLLPARRPTIAPCVTRFLARTGKQVGSELHGVGLSLRSKFVNERLEGKGYLRAVGIAQVAGAQWCLPGHGQTDDARGGAPVGNGVEHGGRLGVASGRTFRPAA